MKYWDWNLVVIKTRDTVAHCDIFLHSGEKMIDRAYNESFSQRHSILTEKISTETWSEEFEPFALENFEFENRQIKNFNRTFSHYRSIKIPIWESKKDIVRYISHLTTKSIHPSYQSLIDKFKAVVFEKDQLKYGDISILIALLPFLANRKSTFNVKHKLNKIWTPVAGLKEKLSIDTLIEKRNGKSLKTTSSNIEANQD